MNLIEFTRRYGENFADNGASWMVDILEGMIESGLTVESIKAKQAEMNDKMFEPGVGWVDKGFYWSVRDRMAAILQGWEILQTTGKNIFKKS